jgi:hypothetical protein
MERSGKVSLVLAMPGLGKTTMVKRLNDKQKIPMDMRPAMDFDYPGPRIYSLAMRTANSRYLNTCAKEMPSLKLITFFAPNLNPDALDPKLFDVYVVVPSDDMIDELAARVVARVNDHVGTFELDYVANLRPYRRDWLNCAYSLSSRMASKTIFVKPGEYLSDYLHEFIHED